MEDRTDITLARSVMAQAFGFGRDIAGLARLLPADEEALRLAGGEYRGESGLLVLTNRRLRFVARDEIRFEVNTTDVTDARCDCGALFGTVTIVTRRGRVVVRRVSGADGAALAEAAGGRCSHGYLMPRRRTG